MFSNRLTGVASKTTTVSVRPNQFRDLGVTYCICVHICVHLFGFLCLCHPKDLTVTLTSERSYKEVDFAEDVREKCSLNTASAAELQEWKVHSFLNTWSKTWTDENKKPKTTHSAFCAACKASRRPEFFIWNIILVMVRVRYNLDHLPCEQMGLMAIGQILDLIQTLLLK